MIPYYNLSRGTLCGPPKDARYCRIQSTWLEQKRWEDVLLTVPVDMYYHLSQGHKIIVHDQSEKPRLSRAQWQGLSWIRFATTIAWYEASPAEFSRSGMHVNPYWNQQYAQLSAHVRTFVGRFKEWAVSDSAVRLEPCKCRLSGVEEKAA
jgi:hypothetical protein